MAAPRATARFANFRLANGAEVLPGILASIGTLAIAGWLPLGVWKIYYGWNSVSRACKSIRLVEPLRLLSARAPCSRRRAAPRLAAPRRAPIAFLGSRGGGLSVVALRARVSLDFFWCIDRRHRRLFRALVCNNNLQLTKTKPPPSLRSDL